MPSGCWCLPCLSIKTGLKPDGTPYHLTACAASSGQMHPQGTGPESSSGVPTPPYARRAGRSDFLSSRDVRPRREIKTSNGSRLASAHRFSFAPKRPANLACRAEKSGPLSLYNAQNRTSAAARAYLTCTIIDSMLALKTPGLIESITIGSV